MSSPPPSPPMVWPPSNPSGTVIPFPLPWGQTGCCPPGGMDALMKCYCDLQQASAFIGQIMLDQINNNPAITAAIIAAIEASGSSLPLIGVTNGQAAQPGQVGEFTQMFLQQTYTAPAGGVTQTFNLGVLQPGDWDVWAWANFNGPTQGTILQLTPPIPPGFGSAMVGEFGAGGESLQLLTNETRALISVPTLIVFTLYVQNTTDIIATVWFNARRAR